MKILSVVSVCSVLTISTTLAASENNIGVALDRSNNTGEALGVQGIQLFLPVVVNGNFAIDSEGKGQYNSLPGNMTTDEIRKFTDAGFTILSAKARYSYNSITQMELSEGTQTVVLEIGLNGTPSLPEGLSGKIVSGEISVTSMMAVDMSGDAGVSVDPQEPLHQHISTTVPARWQWTLTPRKVGTNHTLTTTFFTQFSSNAKVATIATKRINYDIKVSATTWHRIKARSAELMPVWAFIVSVVSVNWSVVALMRRRSAKSTLKPHERMKRKLPKRNGDSR